MRSEILRLRVKQELQMVLRNGLEMIQNGGFSGFSKARGKPAARKDRK